MLVKLEHEVPKQVIKVGNKLVAKTEKKLVGILKDQSQMIEALQSSYKEKLVASRDGLVDQIDKVQKSLEEAMNKGKLELSEMI